MSERVVRMGMDVASEKEGKSEEYIEIFFAFFAFFFLLFLIFFTFFLLFLLFLLFFTFLLSFYLCQFLVKSFKNTTVQNDQHFIVTN